MITEQPCPNTDLDTSGILNTKGPYTDIDDFLDAVNGAKAGDMIILADNDPNKTYDVSSDKDTKFSRTGTETNPIIVRVCTVGKAILTGSAAYRFDNCQYFTWYGFKHKHEASSNENNIIFEGGNDNRFARCEVNLEDRRDDTHWLNISNCKTMKVDHCHFHHKSTKGNFCIVGFDSNNRPEQGTLIEYNYFQNQDLPNPNGDAGGGALRIGHSSMSRRYIRAIFRYNYLEQCNGDGEIITNKSSGNIYYNNSFVNNDGALTLRHGDSTAVLGNYFEGNNGLRICGADNLIANNHFTLNSNTVPNRHPLVIMKGNGGSYERVENNYIILNTFANGSGTAAQIVLWGSGGGSEVPIRNKFCGNIITGENGSLLKMDDDDDDPSNKIRDNIGWVTGEADYDALTEKMATRINPLLARDPNDGIYRLQSGSPARNKFTGTPFSDKTTVDIDGETRTGNTDAGCDQYSEASTKPKKRIIHTENETDVGPEAWTFLGDSPVWHPHPERDPD